MTKFEDGLAATINEIEKDLNLKLVSKAHEFLKSYSCIVTQNENDLKRTSNAPKRMNRGDAAIIRQ